MKNTKVILFAGLITVSMLSFLGTVEAEARHAVDYPTQDSKPSWVINMENRGNDPTTKIGYGCPHGRMSFSCD